MEKRKYPMRRLLDVFDAVSAVDDNDMLPIKTSHDLGKLKDKCKSESRQTVRQRERLTRKFQTAAAGKKAEEVEELSSQFLDDLDTLLDIESGEIEIPDFKRSDFEAKEDITHTKETNGVVKTTSFKKGQSLVPVKFFSLMGDLVKD